VYLADEKLMAVIDRLLGHNTRISFTSAIINEPGNERGEWHADWPFNQKNAGHIPAPYPDVLMHVTTLWMLSPFSVENGGTFVLPGSHRHPTNPTAGDGPDPRESFSTEFNVTGSAGSIVIMDSRLWHATAPNCSPRPRVALAVRYAPWWLNLEVLRPESDERKRMCDETGRTENIVPSINRDVFNGLPSCVRQLYRHWLAAENR
jgi:ectoine hydroxylase-related dioxygenase (phytanoyl-CoA dioxygenase family)